MWTVVGQRKQGRRAANSNDAQANSPLYWPWGTLLNSQQPPRSIKSHLAWQAARFWPVDQWFREIGFSGFCTQTLPPRPNVGAHSFKLDGPGWNMVTMIGWLNLDWQDPAKQHRSVRHGCSTVVLIFHVHHLSGNNRRDSHCMGS